MFLLVTLFTEVIGFDYLNELYEKGEDFGRVWSQCQQTQFVVDGIHLQDFSLLRESAMYSSKFFKGASCSGVAW